MQYKIETATGTIRTNPTHAQRTSALFSEAPIIGGRILRRGQSIILSELQMKHGEIQLQRLLSAGAIKITPIASLEEIGKMGADAIIAELKRPSIAGLAAMDAAGPDDLPVKPVLTEEEKRQKEVEAYSTPIAAILEANSMKDPLPEFPPALVDATNAEVQADAAEMQAAVDAVATKSDADLHAAIGVTPVVAPVQHSKKHKKG